MYAKLYGATLHGINGCIITLCSGFYLLAQLQANPIQEESKHTSIQIKTSISSKYSHSTHYNQSSEAQTMGLTAEASHLYMGIIRS